LELYCTWVGFAWVR